MARSMSNRYFGKDAERLFRRFPGDSEVGRNYSQAFQDMFVLGVLGGKRDGVYVEVGGYHGTLDSNTYLLESAFGWRGIAFEIVKERAEAYNAARRNKCLCADALMVDYKVAFEEAGLPRRIDYLQLDVEPAEHTLMVLKRMPMDEYRFSVVTFETDVYQSGEVPKREAMRVMAANGYELVAEDVGIAGHVFEDWYVDPREVAPEAYGSFKGKGRECADCVMRQ